MGFLLAFLTALFASLKDLSSKIGLKKDINEYIVGFGWRFFALPIFVVVLLFQGIPTIEKSFWIPFIISGSINTIVTILFVKALKYSDISKVTPLISFTPLFLLITSPIILGESPSGWGYLGVITIVFGSYLLNFKKISNNLFSPFTSLIKERGTRYMLLVAILWSVSANFDKIAVQSSAPVFYVFMTNFLISTIFFIILISKRISLKPIRNNYKNLIPIGLFVSIANICQMYAITLTIVPYVIAIKRTSIIFNIIWGKIFLKEKETLWRFVAALVMIGGVIMILVLN